MSVSNDLGQWFNSIPKITRVWFSSCAVVSIAARLGLVRPQNLVLFVNPIIKQFQVCFNISY
jgi:derlin-1